MKKILMLALICISCLLLLLGCSLFEKEDCTRESHSDEVLNDQAIPIGIDITGDVWKVGAIYYENSLIDINDTDEFVSLYDWMSIGFFDDGTYIYIDYYTSGGSYERVDDVDGCETYILTTERFLTLDQDQETFIETTEKVGSYTTYIAKVIDDNTIEFGEYDEATGNVKVDKDPFILVRKNHESDFVKKNKIRY